MLLEKNCYRIPIDLIENECYSCLKAIVFTSKYNFYHTKGKSASMNELYQEVIVDHTKNPRFKGCYLSSKLNLAGKNPLCGDCITVYCHVTKDNMENDYKIRAGFQGSGCSISQASASIMCDVVQNKDFKSAMKTIRLAEDIYTGKAKNSNTGDLDSDIEALSGVSQFPVRIKCAALAWKTLKILLQSVFSDKGEFLGTDAIEKSKNTKGTVPKLKIVSTE